MVDKMIKSMLRTGMVVKLRHHEFDNDMYMVMLGVEYAVDEEIPIYIKARDIFVSDTGWFDLADYDEDMTYRSTDRDDTKYDIIEVYIPNKAISLAPENLTEEFDKYFNLYWQRDLPSVEMTVAEIEEKLGVRNLKIIK